jgi:tRNA A37 threonylcarbamoyladenosine dehydratase
MNEMLAPASLDDADLERRFGGLRRLYGDAGYARLRSLRVAVIGLGGVGSWAAEALARSGVAELVLIDLDQVSESNINRQVQALGATVGQSKVDALGARIADIHPGCKLHRVEEFVEPGRPARLGEAGEVVEAAEPGNWPALLPVPVDVVIDACDQVRAKLAIAAWAVRTGAALVCCGAAGGKRQAHRLEVDDLANASHDPLLASLRNRLRREHGAPRSGRLGLRCVFSRETVAAPPDEACEAGGAQRDATLNCHGYGSSVMVTASFGMAAAGEAVAMALAMGTQPAR